jgi:signal peptidase II
MDRRLVSFGIASGVVILDRLTKMWIDASVSIWDTYVVIPHFFNIVHTQNRGAAFGLFADSSSEWRGFLLMGVSLAVLALVAVLLWQFPQQAAKSQWVSRLGLALVLGGAIGNLYDRAVYGSVTDFLEFYIGRYHWPAFNVADSAITIGAALLALGWWQTRPQGGQA